MTGQFIGRGWAFPLRTDPGGGIALVGGDRDVGEAIRLILGTAQGERPMRPDFGCGIHELVFDSGNDALAGRIAADVEDALVRWEPRIDLRGVDVEFDGQATAWITVRYALRDTNDERNLVFPFYTLPEE